MPCSDRYLQNRNQYQLEREDCPLSITQNSVFSITEMFPLQ